jgi:hypothetical protein
MDFELRRAREALEKEQRGKKGRNLNLKERGKRKKRP